MTLFPDTRSRARAAALLMLGASPVLADPSGYGVDPLSGAPSSGEGGSSRPQISQPAQRQLVTYQGAYAPGTVVVSTSERRLVLVLKRGAAIQYTVGVGRPGLE